MTRSKKLVYEDVEGVFLDLIQSDRQPTTLTVRERLKRGSNTTILKYLNQAKEKHNYAPPASETDHWEKAMAQATAIFTDERAIWEKEKQDILRQIESLEAQRDAQKTELESLKALIKHQEEAFKRLLRSFDPGAKP